MKIRRPVLVLLPLLILTLAKSLLAAEAPGARSRVSVGEP